MEHNGSYLTTGRLRQKYREKVRSIYDLYRFTKKEFIIVYLGRLHGEF